MELAVGQVLDRVDSAQRLRLSPSRGGAGRRPGEGQFEVRRGSLPRGRLRLIRFAFNPDGDEIATLVFLFLFGFSAQ